MKENKNMEEEEHPDENTLEKINSPEETVVPGTEALVPEEPQTTNIQPQTEEMEVHHHSHAGHGKKNWKTYFWEFLMLFLAVFCGFLAEYKLEHIIESDRGKQYAISFYEDLKIDTANFTRLIGAYEMKLAGLAGFNECFETLRRSPGSDSCMAGLFLYSSNFPDLVYTDRTLLQLKNAGGLRLLKKDDADSILTYDYQLRQYLTQETTSFQELQYTIRNSISVLQKYQSPEAIDRNTGSGLLIAGNGPLLNTYFNLLERYILYSRIRLTSLLMIKSKAETLLVFFKNKYHLE